MLSFCGLLAEPTDNEGTEQRRIWFTLSTGLFDVPSYAIYPTPQQ